MGVGFVILIHLIALSVLSFICAVIGSLITYFVSQKGTRKRKVLLAFIAPFVGFFTLYVCGIIGSSIVSEYKKVDIGIGDAWYVPLQNNKQLLFIDLPEQASITEENGRFIVSEISKIQENGEMIYGELSDEKYFSYNTKTDEIKNFSTEKELITSSKIKGLKLIDGFKFYSDKRSEMVGYWLLFVGIMSLAISVGIIFILKRIIFFGFTKIKLEKA